MNLKVGREIPVTAAHAVTRNCLWFCQFFSHSALFTVLVQEVPSLALKELQCSRKKAPACSVIDETKEKPGLCET